MGKRRTINVIILALCAFALIGSIFFMYIDSLQKDFAKEITVEIADETSVVLDAEKPDLKPGESYSYTVILACKAEGRYDITLNFKEIKRGGLENFVSVETVCNGMVCNRRLDALFESGSGITYECEIKQSPATSIKITYSMPEDVGNEAQGTDLDFNVLLTAVRKV